MYGHPIERSDRSASGWSNALLCPHCGGASLRFATDDSSMITCPPTDDTALYIDLCCSGHRCGGYVTLVVRQHAGIIHLSITAAVEPREHR